MRGTPREPLEACGRAPPSTSSCSSRGSEVPIGPAAPGLTEPAACVAVTAAFSRQGPRAGTAQLLYTLGQAGPTALPGAQAGGVAGGRGAGAAEGACVWDEPYLCSHLRPATYQLCGPGKLTQRRRASVSSSVRWKRQSPPTSWMR